MEVERDLVPGREPKRTCVGCRQVAPQTTMVRVVGTNHAGKWRVTVDEKRLLPGRGAWLHPDQNCINRAVKRRVFNRALRISSPLDLDDLISRFSNDHL